MEGLLQLIALSQSPMENVVSSPEISCRAVHECCSKHMSLKNQEGMLCTLFDIRYIFTTIDGIPHLLPLFPPQNVGQWSSVLSTVVWQKLALQYHKRFLDGTVVKFDAVRVKRTPLYQILCVWIDCKPKCFQLPDAQQFLVIQCHSAVPCTYSGPEKDLISVNINGKIKRFEKPGLTFQNEMSNVTPCGNTFSGFFLEIMMNSADSSDIHSKYHHSLTLHAIYEGNLPLSLASIIPMTIYVQNGLGNLEPSQANHTLFLDATVFKEENNLMCTVNGTEQSTRNGLPYFHFCPHKKYSAYVVKSPIGNYTAYALQDCLCCDYDSVSCSESASYSHEQNPNCLSSPYWFCRGSVMSLDYKQSTISQSNEVLAQMNETSMDTGFGPLEFGSPIDLDPATGGNPNLEFNDPAENKTGVDVESMSISENSAPCSSIASSRDESDTNYFEEQTRREKHLSLHPEWVSKSESPEKAPPTQVYLDSKAILDVPLIEEDSKFSLSTARNLQYIMKFNENNEGILDSDYVHCLDDIYEELSSCCLIPSTPESFPICFGGEDIFVLQNCTDFRGCCVANSIAVVARNERFGLLKVPFEKLYVVCPLDKLPHLPLETRTSVLYSKESCTKILGAEVCVGFLSWSADRPPVLCRHWCAEHGLQVKPVNDLSYISIFSANNKGWRLHDCTAGTNLYPPFSESTLSSLEFKIVPADVIAFERGLLHIALDNAYHDLVTCPPENVFLADVKSYINDMLQNKLFDTKVYVVLHSTKIVFVYDELKGNDCLHICDDHHPVAILRRQKLPVTTCQLIPDLCIINDSSLTELSTDDTKKHPRVPESIACKQSLKNTTLQEGASFGSSERATSNTPTLPLVTLADVSCLQPCSVIGGSEAMTSDQLNSDETFLVISSAPQSTQLSSSAEIGASDDHLKCNQIDKEFTTAVSKTTVYLCNYVVPLMKKNLEENCALLSAANKIILLPLANIHNRASLLKEVELHPQKKFSITLLCAELEPPILFDELSVNMVSVFAHVDQRPPCCREILAFWNKKGNIISHLEAYEMMHLSNATETSKLSVLGKIVVLGDEYGILKFSVAMNGTAYYAKFSIEDLEVLDSSSSNKPLCTGYSAKACLYSCCYAVVKQDTSKHPISECGFLATHVLSGSVENILRNVAQNSSNSDNWSLLLEHFVSLSFSHKIETVEDWNAASYLASSSEDVKPKFAEHIDNLLRMGHRDQMFGPPNEGTSLEHVDVILATSFQPNKLLDSKQSTKTTIFSNNEGISASNTTIFSANTESTLPPTMETTFSSSTETTSSLTSHSVEEKSSPTGIEMSPCIELVLAPAIEILSAPASEITSSPGTEMISSPGTEKISPGTEKISPGTEKFSRGTEKISPGTEKILSAGTEFISSRCTEMTASPGVEMASSLNTEMISSLNTEMISSLGTETTMSLSMETATGSLGTETIVSLNTEMTASPNTEITTSPNMLSKAEMTSAVDTEMTSTSLVSCAYSEDTELASCEPSKNKIFLEQFSCNVVVLKPTYAILCNDDKYVLLPLSNLFETCFLNVHPSIQAAKQLMENNIHVLCLQIKENIKIAKLSVNYFAMFAYIADAPQILPDLVAHWKSWGALSKKDVSEILSASKTSTASKPSQSVFGKVIAAENKIALLKFRDVASGNDQFAKVHLESISFLPSTKSYLTIPNVNLGSLVEFQCVASVVHMNQFLFPCYQAIEAVFGNYDEVHNYVKTDLCLDPCTFRKMDTCKPHTTFLNNAVDPNPHMLMDPEKQVTIVKAKQEGKGALSFKKMQSIQFDSVKENTVGENFISKNISNDEHSNETTHPLHLLTNYTPTDVQASVVPNEINTTASRPSTTHSFVISQATGAPSQVNKTTIGSVVPHSTTVMQSRVAPNQVNKKSFASAVTQRAELSDHSAKGTKSCQVDRVVCGSIMSSIKGVASKKLQIPPVTNNILNKVHHYCAAIKHCCDDYAILYANNHYIFLPYNKLYSNSKVSPFEILNNSENAPSVLCVSVKSLFSVNDFFVDGFCFAAFFGKKPSGLETVKKVIEFADPKTLQQSINSCVRNYIPLEEGMVNSSFKDCPDTTNIKIKIYETKSNTTVERCAPGKISEDFKTKKLIKTETLNQLKNGQEHPSPKYCSIPSTGMVTASRPIPVNGQEHPSPKYCSIPSTGMVTASRPIPVPTGNQTKYPSNQEVGTTENRKGDQLMFQNKINNSSSNIGKKNLKKNQVPAPKKPTNTIGKLSQKTDNVNLKLKQTVAMKSFSNGSLKSSGKTVCANAAADIPSTSSVPPRVTSAENVLPPRTHESPVCSQMSNLLQGKIIDTHPDLGELETADGKKLIFQPKQCFLFGVSLQGLELWHILVKELAVEYEVNNDAGTLSIRAVYVGGWNAGHLNNSEIKRNIIDWCLDKCVPDDARNSLVDRVASSSMRHEIVPQIDDNDDREVVVIGSDDSDQYDVELK